MRLVRAFTLRTLQFKIVVQARHIPELDNSIQQMERFRELAPRARKLPECLPPEVWLIGGMRPSIQ